MRWIEWLRHHPLWYDHGTAIDPGTTCILCGRRIPPKLSESDSV